MTNDKALEAARAAYEHHQDVSMDQQHSSVSAYIDALENALQAMQARAEAAEIENDRLIADAQAAWSKHGGTEIALGQWKARAEAAERERDHWKANHAEMVQRNAVLRERPDLPADRLPSIARYEARVKELEAENARLRRLDAEYGRVETAIIMADPDFDGDSPHDNCGDRLIASVHRLRDLAAHTALKGGSNG